MSKGLSSMSIPQRDAAIHRRLKEGEDKGAITGGLGYWAARDALRYMPVRAVAPRLSLFG